MLVILREIRNGWSLMIRLLWDSVRTILSSSVLEDRLISMCLMITNGIRLIRPPSPLTFYFMRKLVILHYKLLLSLSSKRICSLRSIHYPKSYRKYHPTNK